MSKPLTAHRVFVSHSSKDKELVRDIVRRLREAGFESDVGSEDIRAGSDWKSAVRRRIREAETVLFLVTPESLASQWTMTELGIAEGLDRRVIPVTVGIAKRDLPAPLKTYRTVPFDRLDSAISQLSATPSGETED